MGKVRVQKMNALALCSAFPAGCLQLNAEDLDFTPLKGHCHLFVMLLSVAKKLICRDGIVNILVQFC